jgi:hypothetical protein
MADSKQEIRKRYLNFINKIGVIVSVFILILTIITIILAVVYTLQYNPESIPVLMGENFLFSLTLPIIIIPVLSFLVWLIFLIKKLWKKVEW